MDRDPLDVNLEQPLQRLLALEQYRLRELHGVAPTAVEAELKAAALMPNDIVRRVAEEIIQLLEHELHEEDEVKATLRKHAGAAPRVRTEAARKTELESQVFLRFNSIVREQHDALARMANPRTANTALAHAGDAAGAAHK